jgi:hypothetical protein
MFRASYRLPAPSVPPKPTTLSYLDTAQRSVISLLAKKAQDEVIRREECVMRFKLLWKLYVKSLVSVTGHWHEAYMTVKPGEMRINEDGPE